MPRSVLALVPLLALAVTACTQTHSAKSSTAALAPASPAASPAVPASALSNWHGTQHIATTFAPIIAEHGSGSLDLQATSGDIDVFALRGTVQAETSTGSIRVQGVLRGRNVLRTESGNVTVLLDAGNNVQVTAIHHASPSYDVFGVRSDSSHCHTTPTPVRTQAEPSGSNFRACYGTGQDGTLEIITNSGTIAVEAWPP